MKKTLLIAAAALAASVISSQAQVYSQNIVGYVNQILPAGFSTIANPLDNSTGASATNLFDTTSGGNDGSVLLTWTGSSFAQAVFDSSKSSGFSDNGGIVTLPAPTLAPGKGFFFNNQAPVFTNTFVGTVHVDGAAAGTNVVGLTTNVISSSTTYVYIASKLPIAGGVSAVLGIQNVGPGFALDGSVVLIPNIVGGAVAGYTQRVYDSGKATGFSDNGGIATQPEPIIPVGGGFFFSNQSGSDISWVQSL